MLELIGANAVMGRLRGNPPSASSHLLKMAEDTAFKEAVTEWLRRNNPPTLGKLIVGNSLKEGLLFTHYSNFFFKGLREIQKQIDAGKTPRQMASGYSKLDDLHSGLRVAFQFHHEHLLSTSSWGWLSGQQRLLLVGLITEVKGDVIEAIPYVIGNPAPDTVGGSNFAYFWTNRLELPVDVIDSFSAVRDLTYRPSKKDLAALKDVPEASVKQAFAEIIGEPTVPKDWGGERSDLFTSRLILDGTRVPTAFAFKGPAKFEPMTLAGLGKNGDQIDRLFTEPADLFVVQHCHEITTPVRGTMRAYAQQVGRPRLFCLIDGYDTIRVLSAYGKCGFQPDGKRVV